MARFSSIRVLSGNDRSTSSRGASSCGRALSGNAPAQPAHFPLRPPLSRAALESNSLTAVRTSGPLGGNRLSSSARRNSPRVLNGHVPQRFHRGARSCGRALRGKFRAQPSICFPFGPPCHGRPSVSYCLTADALGPVGPSAMEAPPISASSGALLAARPNARVLKKSRNSLLRVTGLRDLFSG